MVKKGKNSGNGVAKHVLVPKHEILSDKEKEELLKKYKITLIELPKISMNDPVLSHLELTTKDVIKITRKSATAGETVYYRRVVK